ncbi:DUF6531 domain-containing protein [Actinoplanes sp. NEAU-A12]|uniref:DUF6531 domain-containing protein n=1 Tax=Actinoplanes sandaracinus TaxID=3045177 RepID=A0ABT6WYI1_9ACTN|nr:DUF6531 domain-containing protein [Actinoplanes sandaracinus]MDI6104798.1 DUF6531 domain-containing protein [Actinoplanes sandaracinus]
MPISSARPDDLNAFAAKSRASDEALRGHHTKLIAVYREFLAGTSWGHFDADSLLRGLDRYLDLNEVDAQWVVQIAAAFQAAGGSGNMSRLPDAAIKASLRGAGLSGGRASVTFDDPVAYGMPPTTGYTNDPVNTASGNFIQVEDDLSFTGLVEGMRFTRTYNSRSDRAGPFGPGWSSWATARLRPRPDGMEYEGPDGQRAVFPRMGAGYGRVLGVNALVEALPSGWVLQWFGGGRWEFDAAGLPVRADRGPGTAIWLRHDDDGQLVELTHAAGKRLSVAWDGARITSLACSDGRRVSYRYDPAGHLVEVEGATGTRCYDVDDNGRLVSVTDADGVAEAVNTYDAVGRVIEQRSRFGRRTLFAYLPGGVTVTSDDVGGPTNTYIHDRVGRLLAVIDGHGERFTMNYDDWGNPVAVTERNGAVTVQEWDGRARLVRRVLPTGAEFTFSYDDADRVVEVAASTDAVTRYRYEGEERTPSEIVDAEGGVTELTVAGGLIKRISDPDSVELRFAFDRDGNVVAATDADGQTARFDRDPAGRITATITPSGWRTTFAYEAQGKPLERRDPIGAVWRYGHTPGGRMTSVTDPTGAREEIHYGEHGNSAAFVDALGHATSSRYDTFGNLIGMVAPDGAKWELGYDELSRLTSLADPAGAMWLREYDVNGNLTDSIDPVGTRHTTTLDLAGRVVAVSDGAFSSTFDLDPLGRVLAHRRADGSQTRTSYDRCSRPTTVEDPTGAITRTEYTLAGRIRRVASPSGRVVEYEYDRCGRLAARINGAGRRWEHRYDADGGLTERVSPGGDVERFSYDAAGRLVESTTTGQGTTRYGYDAAGRVVSITDRVAGLRRFSYDPAGRLVEAIDANGGTTRYSYNERGWPIEIVDPMGGTVTRRYDEAGRIVAETDALGRTATLTYDAAGRLTEHVDGAGNRMRCSYDTAGRVSAFGPVGRPPVTIERDALGRAVVIDEPGSFRHRLCWDPAGRLVERHRDGLAMRWRYNEDGDRSEIGYPDGTETTYTYDPAGLVTGLHHPALGTVELERDLSGRLVGATGDGMRARWRYDNGELTGYEVETGGKRRVTELTRDALGRVASGAIDGDVQLFSYDAAGLMTSAAIPAGAFAFTYDSNGRLVHEASPAGTVEYRHDVAGQLISRRQASVVTTYEYDGSGRRVSETEASSDSDDSVGSDDADEFAPEAVVDALGELAEVNGTPLLWDTADPLTPLCWMGGKAVIGNGSPWGLAGAEEITWLAPDWQGTIGEARDPWGAAAPTPSGTVATAAPRLGYRGEVEFGGLIWLRNRVYDPATRSFLQPDPRPPVPGTSWAANPYHYAGNNPINLVDPLGLRPVSDAELRKHRDQMGHNLWEREAPNWLQDNWDTVAVGVFGSSGLLLSDNGRKIAGESLDGFTQRAHDVADLFAVVTQDRHLGGRPVSQAERDDIAGRAPGALSTVNRLVTSYLKGVWVDGAWGTVKSLYGMVNFTDWETFSTSWIGLGKLALALNPLTTAVNEFTDLPGLKRGELGRTLVDTGKSLLAWDTWKEDPARASGQVVFGVVEAVLGTKGAGAAAKAAKGAGAAAKAASAVVRKLETTGLGAKYIAKLTPAQQVNVLRALDRWNVDASGKNQGVTHIIDYASGSGGPGKTNRLAKLEEYTGRGPFDVNDPNVITEVTTALDGLVANVPPEGVRVLGEKTAYFVAKDGSSPPWSAGQKGISVLKYKGRISTFQNGDFKKFTKLS